MIYVSSSATNLRPHAITGLTYGGGSDCAGCFVLRAVMLMMMMIGNHSRDYLRSQPRTIPGHGWLLAVTMIMLMIMMTF